jgi:copper chaperone NosL
MKKITVFLFATMLFSFIGSAFAQEDIAKHPSCKYCGMDREKFAFSRMLIEYEDGTSTGVCSLHCAAVETALNIDRMPTAILVADFNSKKLIAADNASWVIGGNKSGVMTKRAKWAFEKKEDAETFIRENGGAPSMFDEVVKAAYADMYDDTKMIRERRKIKKQTMEHQH